MGEQSGDPEVSSGLFKASCTGKLLCKCSHADRLNGIAVLRRAKILEITLWYDSTTSTVLSWAQQWLWVCTALHGHCLVHLP